MSAMPNGRLLLIAAGVTVAAAIVTAVTLEPPHQHRAYKLDGYRMLDLSALEAGVNRYWKRHQVLPASLEVLAAEPGFGAVKDPEPGAAYEYEVTGRDSFRLCATFASASRAPERHPGVPQYQWLHGAGRQCFDRTVKDSG